MNNAIEIAVSLFNNGESEYKGVCIEILRNKLVYDNSFSSETVEQFVKLFKPNDSPSEYWMYKKIDSAATNRDRRVYAILLFNEIKKGKHA